MSKSTRLIVRIDPEQLAQVERAAKAEGKSTSEWARDLFSVAVAPPTIKISNLPDPSKWEPNFGTVVAPEYWDQFEAAAKADGVGIEEWIKQACLSELLLRGEITIKEELPREEVQRPWPGEVEKSTNGKRRTAADLVASIPGLKMGMSVHSEPPGDPLSLPFVMDLARRYHDDPGDTIERMLTRTRGEALPGKLASWHSDKKQLRGLAAWLDSNHPELGF